VSLPCLHQVLFVFVYTSLLLTEASQSGRCQIEDQSIYCLVNFILHYINILNQNGKIKLFDPENRRIIHFNLDNFTLMNLQYLVCNCSP